MTAIILVCSVTAGAVASLLFAIRVGDRPLEIISKTGASLTFVVLALIRWSSSGGTIGSWLLAGLLLCAAGDVLLLFPRRFDLGLLAFLLGHTAYIAAFHHALPVLGWPLLLAAPLAMAAVAIASWLWSDLGSRRTAVSAYIAVISIMVWGGAAGWLSGRLPWTAAAGAVLFYLSDLAVARQRFDAPSFANRALGLPVYYAAQLLLASTISS